MDFHFLWWPVEIIAILFGNLPVREPLGGFGLILLLLVESYAHREELLGVVVHHLSEGLLLVFLFTITFLVKALSKLSERQSQKDKSS